MSLFDKLGSSRQMTPADMLQQAIETAKANYTAILQQKGLTIPNGMTNPQQMVQHLVQSGQVPQARLQQAMQMMQRMR